MGVPMFSTAEEKKEITLEMTMKTIFSALVALTVLATVAAPASADWNPQDFWRQTLVGP